MKQLIHVSLAGLTFPCAIRYADTARYFAPADPAAPVVPCPPVEITEEDWRYYLNMDMADCAHTEFSMLTPHFSDALMDHNRIILHAVAVGFRGKAYLISAQSGVGKSTQASWLQTLRPGEFSVICGDRPVLEFTGLRPADQCPPAETRRVTTPDGRTLELPGPPAPPQWDVTVHPSAWNGKENWHGGAAAPLAGVILLRRGEENCIQPLRPRDGAIRVYSQLIQTCKDAARIRTAADMTTRLLNSVPLWELTTHQVPDSTRLLLETVMEGSV